MATLRIAAILFLACGGARAQDAAQHEFDAVTIKPNVQKERIFSRWQLDPTFLKMTGYSLMACIERAYDLKQYQVESKAPNWVVTERFDVEARTAAPATQAQMMQILQPALKDAFHLVFHWETREIPVLLLKVGPHGTKIKAAASADGANLTVLKDHVDAYHLAMDDFAEVLGQFVTDRPVLNHTGLAGEYQFHIEFTPKDEDTGAPSIFSALPEQLGLVVQGGKAPVKMFVIDKAERPAGN